jgi:hypothetical protein
VNTVSIRCTARAESAEELEAWLISRLESVEQRYPAITTHLARLSAVPKETKPVTAWLIDFESSAGPLEESSAVGELYHRLRVYGLGLAPTILVSATARDWSRRPAPATDPRRKVDRTPGSEDAGELVGHSSFPASDPPAVWTWEPPGPFPSG